MNKMSGCQHHLKLIFDIMIISEVTHDHFEVGDALPFEPCKPAQIGPKQNRRQPLYLKLIPYSFPDTSPTLNQTD